LNVIDHQIEGRRGSGDQRLVRLADDDMRAAAKLENRKISVLKDRAQPDGFEPARRGSDVACRQTDMADGYRWPLICLRHDFPISSNAMDLCA
jgi:hypothetical protein